MQIRDDQFPAQGAFESDDQRLLPLNQVGFAHVEFFLVQSPRSVRYALVPRPHPSLHSATAVRRTSFRWKKFGVVYAFPVRHYHSRHRCDRQLTLTTLWRAAAESREPRSVELERRSPIRWNHPLQKEVFFDRRRLVNCLATCSYRWSTAGPAVL